MPEVSISWGDLIDKITILEIKSRELKGAAALDNVNRELAHLRQVEDRIAADADLIALKQGLLAANQTLWGVEDRIREKETAREFDAEFIELARSVYRTNDRRAAIKRRINLTLASELIEEKSYPLDQRD